jgi:MFS transporter, ACS family, tartrate transporter
VVPVLLMAVGFALCVVSREGVMVVVGLALISFGANAFLPVFWCVPAAFLTGSAAAGGIALINSIGNLGGFVAPSIVGVGKSMTGSYSGALMMLGGFALVAALMMFAVRHVPYHLPALLSRCD